MTEQKDGNRAAWGKFSWADWESDPALGLCSMGAQGLWIRLLCLAAKEGGYVLVGGTPPSISKLARIVRASENEVSGWLEELESEGVFSRTGKGVIYSRRMVRDSQIFAQNRVNGKKGGNPTLRKQTKKSPPVNPLSEGGLEGGVKAESESESESESERGVSCETLVGSPSLFGDDVRTPTKAIVAVGRYPDPEFDRWYADYPRKEARKDAERAFGKAWVTISKTGADPAMVLNAGLAAYRRKIAGWSKDKIAHPATWLNAERWNDEETDYGTNRGGYDAKIAERDARNRDLLEGARLALDRTDGVG